MAACRSVSASFLISQNPDYCGVLDKRNDDKKLFGKSSSRRYGVISNGIFYLFKDNCSKEALFAHKLSHISVIQNNEENGCFSFTIVQNPESKQRGVPVAKTTFLVGSFRELQEWHECFDIDDKYLKINSACSRDAPDGASIICNIEDERKADGDDADNESLYLELTSDGPAFTSPQNIKSDPLPPIPCEKRAVLPDRKLSKPETEARKERSSSVPHFELYQNKETISRQASMKNMKINGRKTSFPPYEVMEDDTYTPMHGAVLSSDEETYSVPEEVTEGQEDAYENCLLPKSAFQWKIDKENATMLLTNIAKEGMYLFRRGSEGYQVLTVFLEGRCRHYKIFQDDNKMFLFREHPQFFNLFDLIQYYTEHALPNITSTLSCPYG